jgi:peroxiredoxin
MKHTSSFLALLILALGAAPLHAGSIEGKKEPQKQEKKKEPAKPADKKPVEAAAKPVAIGLEIDPATSLSDSTGKAHTFKQYRGRIVVLSFWSTSSARSAQAARLSKIAQDYAGKNVTVLAIDPVPGESTDAKGVQDVLKKTGSAYPVLLDEGAILAERLGAHALDQVFVLDGKGVVRYTGAIDDDPKGEKADKAEVFLTAALNALVEGKEVTPPTTTPNGGALRLPKRKPAASTGGKR